MDSEVCGSSAGRQIEVCVASMRNLEIDLTLSGGCITISADMTPRDQESVLKEADTLLYQAKETRNRPIWQRLERAELVFEARAK